MIGVTSAVTSKSTGCYSDCMYHVLSDSYNIEKKAASLKSPHYNFRLHSNQKKRNLSHNTFYKSLSPIPFAVNDELTNIGQDAYLIVTKVYCFLKAHLHGSNRCVLEFQLS